MAPSRDTDHNNMVYLRTDHEMAGRVRDIGSTNDLACHLILEHQLTPHKIKSAMGRQHLLAHAIKALERDV